MDIGQGIPETSYYDADHLDADRKSLRRQLRDILLKRALVAHEELTTEALRPIHCEDTTAFLCSRQKE